MDAMDINVSTLEIIIRMMLAIIFGGIIGWEREMAKKAAGFRTHIMVSLGSAAFTLVMMEMYFAVTNEGGTRSADPTRIIEGIVGGIGFLGAGTIIQSRGSVEGITTAASIWVVGAVGIACGGGHYVIAAITVALAFLVLTVLAWFQQWAISKTNNLDQNRPQNSADVPPAAK